MPPPDLIDLFLRPLNSLGIRYMVSGSVAAMLYGEPRVTHDIDLVAFLRGDDVSRLIKAYDPSSFYVPPREAIAIELARERKVHFNVIHLYSSLKRDVYLATRNAVDACEF